MGQHRGDLDHRDRKDGIYPGASLRPAINVGYRVPPRFDLTSSLAAEATTAKEKARCS